MKALAAACGICLLYVLSCSGSNSRVVFVSQSVPSKCSKFYVILCHFTLLNKGTLSSSGVTSTGHASGPTLCVRTSVSLICGWSVLSTSLRLSMCIHQTSAGLVLRQSIKAGFSQMAAVILREQSTSLSLRKSMTLCYSDLDDVL